MTDKIACLRETGWTEEEVRELLVLSIGNTGHWRREKAEEFPEDNRNLNAAEYLERLETSVASVNPDLFAEYRVVFWTPYFDSSAALELVDVHSEVLRSVGFSLFPKDVNELVRARCSEPGERTVSDRDMEMQLTTERGGVPRN